MKKFIVLLALFPAVVAAAPSSQVAWTSDQLNFVKQGNAAKGKELAASCSGCHGDNGISQIAEYPSLAGQLATYTYKQLRDFADNSRESALMSPLAQGLSEQDSADLAVWFSSLPAAQNTTGSGTSETAEKLVFKGDGKRTLPPCFVCHGADGEGEKQDIPALAGQRADYLAQTLKAYKDGSRHNDIYSRMRLIAEQLSNDEIRQLADYYQALE